MTIFEVPSFNASDLTAVEGLLCLVLLGEIKRTNLPGSWTGSWACIWNVKLSHLHWTGIESKSRMLSV